MSIFIGGAWPYANGSLHLGHISSLLPGDILARYYRLKGERVLYVSGSDCNGTPIAIRAKQEGVTPKEIADRYHDEFEQCFKDLGFSYDFYTRTDTETHHSVVQQIFNELLNRNLIYLKEVEQTFCETCDQFLPDRFVEGICPNCHQPARGDQCENCSSILDPVDLNDKTCKLCGNQPIIKRTEHFYFALSKLQTELEEYVLKKKKNALWRHNAIHLTERYLKEGLQDRAVSRDLPIGVPVPIKGFEDKKIYVWIEAVSGYYSAAVAWAGQSGQEIDSFWKSSTKSYYVHGKDNIPFHTIIWPAILLGINKQGLPDYIVSNEYVTLEKRKLSTSRNWAVWVPDLLKTYHPDSIRYFLTTNAPEGRDTNFSWNEFIHSHNGELLGAYGNFVHRTLKFIEKFYDGEIPTAQINTNLVKEIGELYIYVGELLEKAHFKEALDKIFACIRRANKYFDEQKPWLQLKENPTECRITLATCTHIILNLSQLLFPFLPKTSEKLKEVLGINHFEWKQHYCDNKYIQHITPLFKRIEKEMIHVELGKLFNR